LVTRLSASDRQRIRDAAAAAEARCQIHISVAIVNASDRYALYPLVWGALAALMAGAIVALLLPQVGGREVFAIEAGMFVVVSLLLDWRPLRVRLVPARVRHSRASQLAHREFAARILANRRERGAVLVFLSLGERYAEVLADAQAHAAAGDAVWAHTVTGLVAAAKSPRMAGGVISAIEDLSSALTVKH
jgi:putative membrane protein